MKNSIYQIQIELKGFRPRIWRRILIAADSALVDFNKIIQTTMGWTNTHLHQFIKNDTNYTLKMDFDDFWDDLNNVDYRTENLQVADLLQVENEKIIYEYDFGDGWEHVVTLEKILPKDDSIKTPICVAGRMNCPPEDCGGVWGYANILKILNQPDHEEYEDYLEWLGEDFNPKYFNKDEVNELLKMKDYGCDFAPY